MFTVCNWGGVEHVVPLQLEMRSIEKREAVFSAHVKRKDQSQDGAFQAKDCRQ
jgi:hypothetical protein